MTGIFDGGCFAGYDPETGLQFPVEKLLTEFDRFGVRRGLVGSYRCLYQDLREGNREAAEWAAAYPDRLIPLAVLHPAYYGQSPDSLLTWLKRELGFNVAALFSVPSYYSVDWNAPSVRRIGEAAAGLGMALQAGIKTEAELADVARAWGDLPVPVMIRWMAGHRYKVIASEQAIAARCPRFLFDVGNLSSTGAIEHFAHMIGANRLFFASNSPQNIAASPHAILQEAQLKLDDRQAINQGTLNRALQMANSAEPDSVESVYQTDAWKSLCAEPKVDIHWHPDHWNMGEPALTESEQKATLARFGYERVIMFSVQALNYDIVSGNALTATWLEKDSRAYGLIVVNPLQLEASLEQVSRYAGHPKFVGLKTIQDLYGITLDDPAYEPLLSKAAKMRLPVVAHLPGMRQASERFPGVTFVATHGNWKRAQPLLSQDNVAFDFSTSHASRHETQLARFIQAVGAKRVLFGSDGQLVSPAWSLAKLMDADLKPDELNAILRDNAYRIFPKLKGALS